MYIINFTDIEKSPIYIYDNTLNNSVVDITLIGESTEEYGEEFDENVLHLVENFASYESSITPGTPDLTQVLSPLLEKPTEGELWFNKTELKLYFWNSTTWIPLALKDEISGNSGIITHGQALPLPSTISSYDECSWFVSPQYVDQQSTYIECYTDANAVVYARYRPVGYTALVEGLANYLIIGVKNSSNNAVQFPLPSIPLIPSLTPTPTASATITPTATPRAGASPTPTVSSTYTITPTPTYTITPTPTYTITPTPSITPTITPSQYIFSYVMMAGTFASDIIYNIGYNNQNLTTPTYGNLTPPTYLGYYINALFQLAWANIQGTTSLIIGLTTTNAGNVAPSNVFSAIQFVDNTGILRTFDATTAIYSTSSYNGNNTATWTWNNLSTLYFTPNSSYLMLISGQ